ncbi:MAG: hypothetical protein JO108_31815 [Acidobacteriaceae bacterium]|nr:hypothetical protein [Acidobacteriaceae bacterium]
MKLAEFSAGTHNAGPGWMLVTSASRSYTRRYVNSAIISGFCLDLRGSPKRVHKHSGILWTRWSRGQPTAQRTFVLYLLSGSPLWHYYWPEWASLP